MDTFIKVIWLICPIVIIALLAVIVAKLYKRQYTDTMYNYRQRKMTRDFAKQSIADKKEQIVLFGDSIFEYYDTKSAFGKVDKVVSNRGIAGDTTDMMMRRLYDNALCSQPSTLFFIGGTNDINKCKKDEDILGNIRFMIELATDCDVANIYMCSLLPVNIAVDPNMVALHTNARISRFNTALEALCHESGATYVNLHDALVDETGVFDANLTDDGLHPNTKGYAIITDILMPYMA